MRNPKIENQATLSLVGSNQNSFFPEGLNQKAYNALLQAVIENKRESVKKILDTYPDLKSLLLTKARKGTIIENQNTWATFNLENETVLSIAVKRKQVEMIEILLSYHDNLPQNEEVILAKQAALSAWKPYETKKNEKGKENIVVPFIYCVAAESLVKVFAGEKFPNGIQDSQNKTPVELSYPTESALSLLLNRVSPKEAVILDDYLDLELFLLAVYLAYDKLFDTFQNWKQRDVFCIRVVGLVQSVLSPETVRFLREMHRSINYGYQSIVENESSFKFKNGDYHDFYRSARDSLDGLGGKYSLPWQKPGFERPPHDGLEYLLPDKNAVFTKLCTRDNSNANQIGGVSKWKLW